MANGWDVLQFFINNTNGVFTVSDIMKRLKVSWVTANDNMAHMIKLGLLEKLENNKYRFNEKALIVKKI